MQLRMSVRSPGLFCHMRTQDRQSSRITLDPRRLSLNGLNTKPQDYLSPLLMSARSQALVKRVSIGLWLWCPLAKLTG